MPTLVSLHPTHNIYDVAVVGAGPVGCVTAKAFAQAGKRVLLLEANPAANQRFAGEWLHPKALQVLEDLDLALPSNLGYAGAGFVVYPEDGSDRIALPFASSKDGRSLDHAQFVSFLRESVASDDAIDYVEGVRLIDIDETSRAMVRLADGRNCILHAERIIGADGRHSATRRAIIQDDEIRKIGYIGGLTIENIDLPIEGMGHVCLGGQGPFLMYRIRENMIRVVIDLPLEFGKLRRDCQALIEHIPASIDGALRTAISSQLQQGNVVWTPSFHRARLHYGNAKVTLVGDAVGSFHPLTAAGMTMGFLDAQAVGNNTFESYVRERGRAAYVPELLSSALRRVFASQDIGATTIMGQVVKAWRANPRLRLRTMAFLSAEDTSTLSFAKTFSFLGSNALLQELRADAAERGYSIATIVAAYARWAKWPLLAIAGPGLTAARPFISTKRIDYQFPTEIPSINELLDQDDHILDDREFCIESLKAVSRTFSQPILLLQEPTQTAVMCGYLLCRIADTIEDDASFSVARKGLLFEQFRAILSLKGNLQQFAANFMDSDDEEFVLARNIDRVLKVFYTLPSRMQTVCLQWIEEMSRGMELYTHRRSDRNGLVTMVTVDDLQRYCFYVAGTVGHLLTDVFMATIENLSPSQETILRSQAENFGTGLQLTNILKDVTDDLDLGRSYVPLSLSQSVGLEPYEMYRKKNRKLAHRAVEPLFGLATDKLNGALEYALAIPAEHRDIRLFCLLPLWMAAASLVHARGNDGMFDAHCKVKISRELVAELIHDCLNNVDNDIALRARFSELIQELPPVRGVA